MLRVQRRPRSAATIRRVSSLLGADVFGAWMWAHVSTIAGRRVIAFDGKTLRGARDAAGNLVHLLSGLCQTTVSSSRRSRLARRRTRSPMLAKLLDLLDVDGAVVTADAMQLPARHRAGDH
ncbi:hypothetical protein [Actinocatenispora thailandica]|uniref:hypothetical protein n=1 Tax=Actinocatenispora thailandica TaxID=227318 RepID=UPI0031DF3B7F